MKQISMNAFTSRQDFPEGGAMLMLYCVSLYANDVRQRVGANYDLKNHKNGWKMAKEAGHKVVKIKISEFSA